MADVYSYITFAQAKQQLANRLYDSGKVFWIDAELGGYIKESLRTWNALTSFWEAEFTFQTKQNVTWYDLTDAVNLPNTIRPLTVTDVNLYIDMQYALLEPAVGVNPWTGASSQFTAEDIIRAVQRKRDEIISVTGCFTTRRLIPAVGGRIILPDTVIDIRRVAYQSSSPNTILASDDFNRPDANPIGPPWIFGGVTLNPPLIPAQIISNQLQVGGPSVGIGSYMLYDGGITLPKQNQYSQATLVKPFAAFTDLAGFMILGSVDDSYNLQLFPERDGIGNLTGNTIMRLLRMYAYTGPGGNGGSLASYTLVGGAQAGDIYRMSYFNGVVSCYRNGILVINYSEVFPVVTSNGATTVISGPAGTKPGLFLYSNVLNNVIWDNFVTGTQPPPVSHPMWPEDVWAEQAFNQKYLQQPPGIPETYIQSTQPPLSFDTDKNPGGSGDYEVLTVESGALLSAATPSTFPIPDDWTHVIKWGALADLLSRESNSKDVLRAKYCEQRYKMGMALLGNAPALLALRIANVPIQIDSVRAGDTYRVGWQAELTKQPDSAFHSGLNLIAFAPTPDFGTYSATAAVVQNAPLPASDAANVQVPRENLDAVLDYAQHIAAFKQGGQEFLATLPLMEKFLKQASIANAKLVELGEFTSFLLGISQLQEQMAPRMAPLEDKE